MTLPVERYHVTLTFSERLLGTVPKSQEVYADYIASKAPEDVDTSDEDVPVSEEKGWTGFHTDAGGLYLLDYQVKGMLKEGGNVIKDILSIKALKSKIDNFVFIEPRKIYLGKSAPDGVYERPLRAQTPTGPRVALGRSDYVEAGTQIAFEIVLLDGPVKLKHLEGILDYGSLKGIGQFRNGGFGRFTYEMSKV